MSDAVGGGVRVGGMGACIAGCVVCDDAGCGGALEHDGAVLDVGDEHAERDGGGRGCGDSADGGWSGWICWALYDGAVAGCYAELYRGALFDQCYGAWRCGSGAGGQE